MLSISGSMSEETQQPETDENPDRYCPVCREPVVQEKCKVVCRSQRCTYRIIYTCAEF